MQGEKEGRLTNYRDNLIFLRKDARDVMWREFGERLKGETDVILPALIFALIASMYFWIPEYVQSIQPNTLLAATSPVLTFLGLLIAYRVNDKLRNPKLKIVRWGLYKFKNSVRVFAEVENAAGREIARDARALITIRRIENEKEKSLERNDLVQRNELIDNDEPLVPYETVRVEGEPVPWMIPEVPYQAYGLHRLPLKHVTNIAPGQRNRVALLDILKSDQKYYLRVFSEYGTEKELIQEYIGQSPKPSKKRYIRRIRCALKPGNYKFYLNVSADKARPATGVMQIDTKKEKILFLKPAQEEASLKDLFVGGASCG